MYLTIKKEYIKTYLIKDKDELEKNNHNIFIIPYTFISINPNSEKELYLNYIKIYDIIHFKENKILSKKEIRDNIIDKFEKIKLKNLKKIIDINNSNIIIYALNFQIKRDLNIYKSILLYNNSLEIQQNPSINKLLNLDIGMNKNSINTYLKMRTSLEIKLEKFLKKLN